VNRVANTGEDHASATVEHRRGWRRLIGWVMGAGTGLGIAIAAPLIVSAIQSPGTPTTWPETTGSVTKTVQDYSTATRRSARITSPNAATLVSSSVAGTLGVTCTGFVPCPMSLVRWQFSVAYSGGE
jgi:hypothetical protein